jgi:hypothetical protein
VLSRHKAANWVGRGRGRKSTRPGANGVVELTPFEFLDRLADLVPPPRKHRHRYHGVFAPNNKLRRAVTALAIGNIGKRGHAVTGGQASDLFGFRLRGTLLRVEQGVVWLGNRAIEGPVPLPIATLATLASAALPPAEQVPAPAEATGGIGGHIGSINGRPAVVGLIAGSAAERAGLLPGEVMLAIAPCGDGRFVETAKMSLEETQHLLRGRVGSSLQLRLQASGREPPREVAQVRQEIPQLGRNPQVLKQALQAHDRLLLPAVVNVDQDAARKRWTRPGCPRSHCVAEGCSSRACLGAMHGWR